MRGKTKLVWPIDRAASKKPVGWVGWPEDKQFAFVLTHDVDQYRGVSRCLQISELERGYGFRSAFNFVPEKYYIPTGLRERLVRDGFEVVVHGLYHDGKLFRSHHIFLERAVRINRYLHEWKASGFRSPSMHHNLEWIHDLQIEYDSSTFDTDPFEPQPDGVQMIFPFWVPNDAENDGYIELPYTMPQDLTTFVLLREQSTRLWKEKLKWIADCGGMAMLITHPDYMSFGNTRRKVDEYPIKYFTDFLEYVRSEYADRYWHALPSGVARAFQAQRFQEKT